MLNGVINIYKEKGYTSHDVVAIVRKKLNRVKTGHTGTLDPDARGVLPVCVGSATKISEYLMAETKEYIAELTLGITTTTADAAGEIISERDVFCTNEQITEAVLSFKGTYEQIPPMYSALKINGKRLYDLAREGVEVERKSRTVSIYDIRVLKICGNKVVMAVCCSKGTYIRSLCSDIGQRLLCGGHMSSLLRTRTGAFCIRDSITLSKLDGYIADNEFDKFLKPIDSVLTGFKKVFATDAASKYLYNGNKVSIRYTDLKDAVIDEKLLVYDSLNSLVGIYKVIDGEQIKPVTMLYLGKLE